MPDIAKRFPENPILRPSDVIPSRSDMEVTCLLNPGAFRYGDKTGLLIRVAERPMQREGMVSTPVIDTREPSGIAIVQFDLNDPDLEYKDPRVFLHRGECFLTTLSHLRLAWSDDGIHFKVDPIPTLLGYGDLETFGIEDSRVTEIDGVYYVTFTSVSPSGVGVGMASTSDWRTFKRHGMIIPPHNKDCALFTEKINGKYMCIHRPSGIDIGGNFMWLASSPDLDYWGDHRCLVKPRPNMWDSKRVGAGTSPIRTERGWLEIYHGADFNNRYCLGALLLDLDDPSKVLARSQEPLVEPLADYETSGFFGNVVFTNGHVVDGDTITMYYGASDEFVCGAHLSISEILGTLGQNV